MKVFKEAIFEEIEKPDVSSRSFKALSKAEQLELVNDYKEFVLENMVYQKVLSSQKTVNEIFDNDKEIDFAKKNLALTRYEMLKATRNTDRDYTADFSRKSYVFDCEITSDVKTRFDIYRRVKSMSIRPYLEKDAQTAYNFF